MDHTLIYEENTLRPKTLEALDEEGFHLVKVPFRPTAENFSEYFFRKMEEKGYPVKRAVVYETPNNCAAYRETEEETEEQARRVKSALLQIDARAVSEIRHILASGNIQKEQIAYLYLKEIFRYRAPARDKTYLGCVRAATDVLHAIGKEIEHLKGFIRFRETAAGVYYAACAPDNDILPQLARHFIGRLACPFILHDISRAYALCYNGASVAKIEAAEADVPLSASEEEFAALWASYYRNVAIRARTNPKLQDRLMPRRYRKFMPET